MKGMTAFTAPLSAYTLLYSSVSEGRLACLLTVEAMAACRRLMVAEARHERRFEALPRQLEALIE